MFYYFFIKPAAPAAKPAATPAKPAAAAKVTWQFIKLFHTLYVDIVHLYFLN